MPYGYANYMFEDLRESLGLQANDTSQDERILKWLESGKKMSKSDMMRGSENDHDNIMSGSGE